jgi:hypothetical protein
MPYNGRKRCVVLGGPYAGAAVTIVANHYGDVVHGFSGE